MKGEQAMMQRGAILRRLRGFRRDRRGAIAAMFAAMFPVVFGIVALGVETGVWFSVKRHHQAVADVAAISGAKEIMNHQSGYGTCTSGIGPGVVNSCAAAAYDAKTNGFDFNDSANSASSLTYPYTGGSTCSQTGVECVQVILKHQQGLMTAGYFLSSLTIGNEAIAAIEANPKQPCTTAAGGNSKNVGIQLTGSSKISMPDCMLATNSTSDNSVQVNGSGGLDLYSLYTAGGLQLGNNCANNNCTWTYPPSVYQPKLCDPYDDTKDQCGGDVVSVQASPASLANFTAMPTLPSSATTFTDPGKTAIGSCTAATLIPSSPTPGACYDLSSLSGPVGLSTDVTVSGKVQFKLPSTGLTTSGHALIVDAGGELDLFGGGLTVDAAGNFDLGVSAGTGSGATLYIDTGSLAVSGCAAIGAGTSTINIQKGGLTSASGSTVAFNPSGTVCGQLYTEDMTGASTYNIYTGGKNNGVTLGGVTTFNIGNYYFTNSNSSGAGVAVDGGSTTTPATLTFGGGILSVQNGSLVIGNSSLGNTATASFGSATTCTATDSTSTFSPSPPAGSCIYIANGGFSNVGTATFAGDYYLYAPSGTTATCGSTSASAINCGTLSFGSSGSNTYFIDNPQGTFVNSGTMSFSGGTAYIDDGGAGKGNSAGGFENTGTLKLTGGSDSNYYFLNGTSYGTSGTSAGKCVTSSSIFGALSIMAGSTANFGPGNYYLVNGDLCMNQDKGTGTNEPNVNCVSCGPDVPGITFILTQTGTSGPTQTPNYIGTLEIPAAINTSNGPLYPNVCPGGALPPCSASPYAGLLIFQDRNAALDSYTGTTGSIGTCNTNCSVLQGGTDTNLTGAIYMMQAALNYGAQGTMSSSGNCLLLLVDSLTLSGGAALSASGCSAAGVSNSTIKYVALVQ